MTKTVGDHVYVESGLDNVTLHDVVKYECPSCGAKRIQLSSIGALHRAIARVIAEKPARFVPQEVRFLRDHLGLSNKEFAELMGVTPEQASRWTTSEAIGVPAERFLRVLAVLGPGALASRGKPESEHEQVPREDIIDVLEHLPPSSTPAKKVAINLRRRKAGWEPTAQVN
jgi:DNA-binding transcriptional regulator YiaG